MTGRIDGRLGPEQAEVLAESDASAPALTGERFAMLRERGVNV
ncbi:hypothetical protein [Zhihengliuella halotolerans]|nr:hypothetical protein [Zhihengliuella halotolerans]